MAKRNQKIARAMRHRGSSPYNKYGKQEIRYDNMYRRYPHLIAARRKATSEEARRAAERGR